MSDAHRRPKAPDQTRRALLDAAADQALAHGMAALSLPAVAEAAGVTKGALFHHFRSKQGLIEALCADLIARIDDEIDAVMALDEGGHGTFTRAYVICTFAPRGGGASPWTSLSISAVADPGLARIWADWMQARLLRHATTDSGPDLDVVRLATDGFWLSTLQATARTEPPERLFQRLLSLTRAPRPANPQAAN
ncbi:MAG: TetR/AcrR family transcriptional regulator [Paracoccaceae bacterium]